MPDPRLEDRLDRHARGELTAVEAREFAQKSLDDPDLFEDLTYSALAKKAVSDTRFPRKTRFVVITAAAAAMLALVSIYLLKPLFTERSNLSAKYESHQAPILLGSIFDVARPTEPVFRGVDSESRTSREAGSIVSIVDGVVSIDLGSLDGVAKGSELGIYREASADQSIGRLQITTVFRERARGRILEGQAVRVSDRVRVDSAEYFGVLLEQVDASLAQGASTTAKEKAEKALAWAESRNIPPVDKAKALEKLASIEYQAGSLQQAEQHYRSIVDTIRTGIVYAESLNNLGALAELRGDRTKAVAFYTDAVRALPDSSAQDRRVIETNLNRLKNSH